MMGSHSLVDLRDAICCVSDLQVFGEFSHTPDMAPDFISKVSKCTACLEVTAAPPARLEKSFLRLAVQQHVEQVTAACPPVHACAIDDGKLE